MKTIHTATARRWRGSEALVHSVWRIVGVVEFFGFFGGVCIVSLHVHATQSHAVLLEDTLAVSILPLPFLVFPEL